MSSITEKVCSMELLDDTVLVVGYDKFKQFAFESIRYPGSSGERSVMTHIADPRGRTCSICSRGWDFNPVSMADQFCAESSAAGMRLVHMTCMKGVMAYNQRQLFAGAISHAWLRFQALVEVANEYRGGWNLPWYEAELLDYPGVKIKVGRRKNVDHVEVIGAAVGDIFNGEDATHGTTPCGAFSHAWKDEDLRRCVQKIADALKARFGVGHRAETGGDP